MAGERLFRNQRPRLHNFTAEILIESKSCMRAKIKKVLHVVGQDFSIWVYIFGSCEFCRTDRSWRVDFLESRDPSGDFDIQFVLIFFFIEARKDDLRNIFVYLANFCRQRHFWWVVQL